MIETVHLPEDPGPGPGPGPDPGPSHFDVEALSLSLTGFDEIAISRAFDTAYAAMDGTMMCRALWFVVHRRDGMNDVDAYRTVMLVTIGELQERFGTASKGKSDSEQDTGDDPGKATGP